MNTTVVLEEEPETQGGLVPPAPPRRLAVAVDDPEKPRCADCHHIAREHIEGLTCQGRLSFGTPCTCTNYRPKE